METAQHQGSVGRTQATFQALMGCAAVLAVLSASCCVLPIALSLVGLGGAWLTVLGPFVAYRDVILILVGCVIVWSWIRLWRTRCKLHIKRRGVLMTAVASLAFLVALSAPLWETQLTRSMWTLWTSSS